MGKELKHSAQHGFSLLEALIGIAILSIGILAVATMQGNAWRTHSVSRNISGGTVWATHQMERLMSVPFTHADLGDGSHGPVTQGNYTIQWEVTDDPTCPVDGVNTVLTNAKRVEIIASWTGRGSSRQVSMELIRAR